MIRHDHKRAKFVMTQLDAAQQGVNDQRSDRFLLKKSRPRLRPIEAPIDPDEGSPRRYVVWRRVLSLRQASVQMPG